MKHTPQSALIQELELLDPAFADEILEALAAAGYAVVKTDPIQDQVIRALAAVGWAVVPVEPTEAMAQAAEMAVLEGGAPDFPGDNTVQTMSSRLSRDEAKAVLRAGIEAAQKEPA